MVWLSVSKHSMSSGSSADGLAKKVNNVFMQKKQSEKKTINYVKSILTVNFDIGSRTCFAHFIDGFDSKFTSRTSGSWADNKRIASIGIFLTRDNFEFWILGDILIIFEPFHFGRRSTSDLDFENDLKLDDQWRSY